MSRVTQDELHAALSTLNDTLGTEFEFSRGPGGWKVENGRMQKRRPASEMLDTIWFTIDMVRRSKLKSAKQFRNDYPDPESWGAVICADCGEWNEFCECPEGASEPRYRCDRCNRGLVDEGYWSDMAERGACATEDGGVLCPKCFEEDPLVNGGDE